MIEANLRKEIQINDVISYKHTKISPNGKPIQPRIYQIRRDLTWKDVLANWTKFCVQTKRVARNWRDPRERRNFFDGFATAKQFNPLDTKNWYSVSHSEIIRVGGRRLLDYYNGSHKEALVQIYPELRFKMENFFPSEKGWKATKNRRKFFDEFARSRNFNPLDAKNWRSITRNEILRFGGGGLLKRYNGSHIRALKELYPQVMLYKRNVLRSNNRRKDCEIQRNLFEEFARSNNFNPLHAENWYSVSKKEILRNSGIQLLKRYKGPLLKALMQVYPNLKHQSPLHDCPTSQLREVG